MELWSGELVHSWSHGKGASAAVGGKETWWFTANPGDYVEVWVNSLDAQGENKEDKVFHFQPGDADGHCFTISAVGKLTYSGDSNTGGCTPD